MDLGNSGGQEKLEAQLQSWSLRRTPRAVSSTTETPQSSRGIGNLSWACIHTAGDRKRKGASSEGSGGSEECVNATLGIGGSCWWKKLGETWPYSCVEGKACKKKNELTHSVEKFPSSEGAGVSLLLLIK